MRKHRAKLSMKRRHKIVSNILSIYRTKLLEIISAVILISSKSIFRENQEKASSVPCVSQEALALKISLCITTNSVQTLRLNVKDAKITYVPEIN